MAVDFVVKWVNGSSTFTLSDPYDVTDFGEDEVRYRIPSADAIGTDGEYQEDSFADPRTVWLSGMIISTSADALRTSWQTFAKAFAKGTAGQLYKSSDRYINGRVFSLHRDMDEGLNYVNWSLVIRAYDPWWYDSSISTNSLSLSGSVSIAAGGTYPALPIISIQVTVVGPGTFTITNGTTGQAFTITPNVIGLYQIDCSAGTVTVNGSTDGISLFSGSFWDMGFLPDAQTITTSTTGGCTMSAASLLWRRRYSVA